MILFRLTNRFSEFRSANLQHINDEENDEHENDQNHNEDFLVGSWIGATRNIDCCTIFVRLVRAISTVIPSVTKKSLRDAHLIVDALKFAWIAARSLIVSIVAVCCSVTNKTFIDALAGVAAKIQLRTIRVIFSDSNI